MKEKLLAGLIGACFAAPVLAQSSVTIYGVADAGIQVSRFGNGTQTSLASGIAEGSRLGFKGNEDLGGGYRAIFTLESRLELDTGANSNGYISPNVGQGLLNNLPGGVNGALAKALVPSLQPAKIVNPSGALFDRTSMVGLVTPGGTFLLGRQYTPDYEVFAGADTFEVGTAGGWHNTIYGAGGVLTPGAAVRANNSLQYRLQLPSGFGAALMYGFEETGSLNLSKRFVGGNLRYQANGVNVGLGYGKEQDQNGNPSLTSFTVGGSYAIGDAKIFAGYHRMKNDNSVLVPLLTPAVGAAVAGIIGNNAKLDADSYTLGMQYQIGNGRLMGSVIHTNDKKATNNDVTQYALGYDYNLSKRTDIYTVLAHVSNKNGAQSALGGGGYLGGFTSQPGDSANAFQVGIRHKF